jgi:hypothetical protein
VFQYLPFSEPNPLAEPIEEAPYGATMAYPNLLADQLADELKVADELRIRSVEIGEDIPAEVVRQAIVAISDPNWIYVVLVDGRMFIIPSSVSGERTTHPMASRGADVIAAGQVVFDTAGNVIRWDCMSGHYRPHERQCREVVQAIFHESNLQGG